MRKQAYVLSVVGYFGVLSFGFAPSIRRSENSPSCFLTGLRDRHFAVTKTRLHDSIEKEVENVEGEIILDVLELYPSAELVMKEMMKHQPLGCTVEESMDTVNDPTIVFVSKVVEGGSADNAGIKVGDVLVGVTGLFGEMTPVLKSGVEKIKGLVASVPEDEPLRLQIARGTGVFERHEASVVDLCQSPGTSDKQVEECVVKFLSSVYDTEIDVKPEGVSLDDDDDDDETDSFIDSMMNLWANELPSDSTTSGVTGSNGDDTNASKPKPWSSRSSPSGTYVRDPVTGEMRNIDP